MPAPTSIPSIQPVQPTVIEPIAPTQYRGNAGPALRSFPRDAKQNWHEAARLEMANPGASPADKPKWIKPNPPFTPGMSLADLKALALKNNWEAMAFNRPGPPAVLTVIHFQQNGEPLISTDGKSFAVLDEVHHLPAVWTHHAEIYCRRVAENDSRDEEARRRHVGMHIEALREQIAVLEQDREQYVNALGQAKDSISLKAAADACMGLRTTLLAKLEALLREQQADLVEPRVLTRSSAAPQQPVPGPAAPAAAHVDPADDDNMDRFDSPHDDWVDPTNRGPAALPMQPLQAANRA